MGSYDHWKTTEPDQDGERREQPTRSEYAMTATYSIYNVDTGEELGSFIAANEDHALDVMALDWGFSDYAEVCAIAGRDRAGCRAELQITLIAAEKST